MLNIMTEKELLDDIEFLIGSWFSAIEDEGCDPWENEECMSMASKYGYTKKETLCSVAHHIYNIDEDIVYSPNKYRETEGIKAQSTMHRIAKFDLSKQYNKYVDFRMIEIMEELKDRYNETNDPEDYLRLLYSNPCGFELTRKAYHQLPLS